MPRKNRKQPGEWNFYEKTESCYDLTTLDFGYRQPAENQNNNNNNNTSSPLTRSQSGSVLGHEYDEVRPRNSLVRTQSGLIVPPRRRSKDPQGEKISKATNVNNTDRQEVVEHGVLLRSQSGLLVPPRGRKLARQETRRDFSAVREKKEEEGVMRQESNMKLMLSTSKMSINGGRRTPKRTAPSSPPLNLTSPPPPPPTTTRLAPTANGGKTPPAPPPRKKSLQADTYSRVWAQSVPMSQTIAKDSKAREDLLISDGDQVGIPSKDNVDAFWKLINNNMALNYFIRDGYDETMLSSNKLENENASKCDDDVLQNDRPESLESDSPPPLKKEIWQTPRESWITRSSESPQKTHEEIWKTPTQSWIARWSTSPQKNNNDPLEVWKTPRQSWMTTSDGYIDCYAEFRDCWRTDGGGKEEEKGGKRIQEGIYAQVEKSTKVRLDWISLIDVSMKKNKKSPIFFFLRGATFGK